MIFALPLEEARKALCAVVPSRRQAVELTDGRVQLPRARLMIGMINFGCEGTHALNFPNAKSDHLLL